MLKMYEEFALIYDRVMRGVDYPAWAEYVLNLARKFEFDAARICDLACGTGTLALLLERQGSKVLGIDRSKWMLEQAREKAENQGADSIEWRQGDISNFDLGEKFPLITCLYDSVNYLLSEDEVLSCFQSAARHLEPGGGFIFDVTTEYNIIVNFADYTFAENLDECSYIWENRYNLKKKIIDSEVTIFRKNGDKYYRHKEVHRQRVYPTRQIEQWLDQAGFEVLGAFDGFTLNEPGQKVERIHFVCRKN